MNPVFGQVATSAPKAASFQPMRRFMLIATTKPTMSNAQAR